MSIEIHPTSNETAVLKADLEAIEKDYISRIIKETASESTTHGIDHIFKRENPVIKIFWGVCTLGSTAVCAYMIALSIMGYLEYDTVTKAEQVYILSTNYPAVSFCNLNPFMTTNGTQFAQQLLIDNQMVDPLSPSSSFNNLFSNMLVYYRYFVTTNALGPNYTNQFRQSLGLSINDMLLNCKYNMGPCSADDFVTYFDIFYGNCFTFNSGRYQNGSAAPIRSSTKPGYLNGLMLELYLDEPDDPFSLSSASGIHLVVHNQTTFPDFTSGISVGTGSQTNVQIERIFSSHLEQPYSECSNDISKFPSKMVEALENSGYTYTQANCFLMCFERYSIEKCGCYQYTSQIPLNSVVTKNQRPCLNISDINCATEAYAIFFSMDVTTICGDSCPLECDSVTYNLFTNEADYPSKVYANSLVNNPIMKAKFASNPSDLNYNTLKQTMLQVSVFYGHLGYQYYEEAAKMEVSDLVAYIGGTLGLFLGMSFLSFVEILDCLLQIWFYRKEMKEKNKARNKNSVSPGLNI